MSSNGASSSQAKRDRFLSVFPRILSELLEHLDINHMPEDAKAWFRRVRILHYIDKCLFSFIMPMAEF